jgi:hypothetical protein
MLRSVLDAEGDSIFQISGYATDQLGVESDAALLRFLNLAARMVGREWYATVKRVEGRSYLILQRRT